MSTTRKNNLAQSLQHAMTLWARGDQDAALAITQALFDDAPANEQLALNHSGLLLHKQNFAAAMACLERHQTHAALSPALLANLAIAYRGLDQHDRAIETGAQAVQAAPEKISAWNAWGLALMAAERYDEAENVFREGLIQHPDHALLKHHLNEALEKQGKGDDSTRWSPIGSLLDDAHAFSKEGNPVAAEALYRKAVHFNPEHPQTQSRLGLFLMRFGRIDEARPVLEKAHALNPRCPTTSHFLSLTYAEKPARPNGAYIQQLFDGYAGHFEKHLVEGLKYDVPVVLSKALLDRLDSPHQASVLDLGCGTGLIGEQLRSLVAAIDGVDISEKMLEEAKQKGVYQSLHQRDIRDFLNDNPARWDAITAGDVFIYCGEIDDIVQSAHDHLNQGGWLAFSVELCGGESYTADPTTGRYLHSKAYLERILAPRFDQLAFEPAVIRYNGGEPVEGYLVFAQRAASDGLAARTDVDSSGVG